MIAFYFILGIFGLLFGSFASVIISRIHSKEGGIMLGRSHCQNCDRDLSPLELIPVFSWVLQRGKCKGCGKSISVMYPLLEITLAILFLGVGYFLISPTLLLQGNMLEWMRLFYFLTLMFLTVIFVFYDILYLEIPEMILLIANIMTFGVLIAQGYGYTFFPYLPTGGLELSAIIVCLAVIVGLYTIMLGGLHEILDITIVILLGMLIYFFLPSLSVALASGVLAAYLIFLSFFIQIVASRGKWMGAGDLRIAILMGLICGISFAFPAWMICYVVGSIIGIIVLLIQKSNQQDPHLHPIPFGPFIAIGYLSVLFFAPGISNILGSYFFM